MINTSRNGLLTNSFGLGGYLVWIIEIKAFFSALAPTPELS